MRRHNRRRRRVLAVLLAIVLGLDLLAVAGAGAGVATVPLGTYLDRFDNGYSGSDGSLPWTSKWLENGESDGPGEGSISVGGSGCSGSCLSIGGGATDAGITRRVDLTPASSAGLRFSWQIDADSDATGVVVLLARKAGTTGWTQLRAYSLSGVDVGGLEQIDVSEWAGQLMDLRFQLVDSVGQKGVMAVDDVAVALTADARGIVLDPIGDKKVAERNTLEFTATATSLDGSGGHVFSIGSGAPPGASITPGGDFTWPTTELDGPGAYGIEVVVRLIEDPSISDREKFTVFVTETNSPPVLAPLGPYEVAEETELTFTATAVDPDVPAQQLGFGLAGTVPPGAEITPDGVFRWTPAEPQGPGSYLFAVTVTDDGEPRRSAVTPVKITVAEVNLPPIVEHPGRSDDRRRQRSRTRHRRGGSRRTPPTPLLRHRSAGRALHRLVQRHHLGNHPLRARRRHTARGHRHRRGQWHAGGVRSSRVSLVRDERQPPTGGTQPAGDDIRRHPGRL